MLHVSTFPSSLQLHAIGVLCGLMPSSNVQNYDKVVISRITAGITPVCFDGEGQHGCGNMWVWQHVGVVMGSWLQSGHETNDEGHGNVGGCGNCFTTYNLLP